MAHMQKRLLKQLQREGSAFSDVVDPEIKSAKGSEQKAKKDTSSNQSYTIKESIRRQKHYKQRRFMELRKSQICSGFGSAYLISMKAIFKRLVATDLYVRKLSPMQ